MATIVTATPAGEAAAAKAHFDAHLAFETDCWDVHDAMQSDMDFVLLDVRSPKVFARAHLPGAVNFPYRELSAETLKSYPGGTLFVVYCNGPHCNAAHRAAARLAGLGRPVKDMIGGVMGWIYSGFPLEGTEVEEVSAAIQTVGKPRACTI